MKSIISIGQVIHINILKQLKICSFLFILIISFPSWSVPNWTQRADFPGNGRHRAASFSIGTKGYMGVGHYNGTGTNVVLKDWWEFDPSTNSWSQKADYIGNNGNGNYGVITFSFDDVAFLGGGQLGSNSEFFKYEVATNTWSTVASPTVKPVNTQGFTLNNSGYFVRFGNLWEYNKTTDQWADKGSVPFTVNNWNSGFSLNGKGYIKTGHQLWEYKALTNQWILRADHPGLSTGGSGVFTQNGKAYIVTGYAGGLSQVNSEVWEFDPNSNTWLQYADFPGSSRRFSCTFNIGEKAYIGTGTNGTNFADFWEFNLTVGLNDLLYDQTFTTYPNPAIEQVTFQSENYTSAEITIYSSQGQVIQKLELTNKSITFQRNNLKKGTYFYTVETEGQRIHSNHFIFL